MSALLTNPAKDCFTMSRRVCSGGRNLIVGTKLHCAQHRSNKRQPALHMSILWSRGPGSRMSSGARTEGEHEWVEALGGLRIGKAWKASWACNNPFTEVAQLNRHCRIVTCDWKREISSSSGSRLTKW